MRVKSIAIQLLVVSFLSVFAIDIIPQGSTSAADARRPLKMQLGSVTVGECRDIPPGEYIAPVNTKHRLPRFTRSAKPGMHTLVIGYCVSERGRATDVEVLQSEPTTSYDKVSKSAMNSWRFDPATLDGKTIAVCGCEAYIMMQTN